MSGSFKVAFVSCGVLSGGRGAAVPLWAGVSGVLPFWASWRLRPPFRAVRIAFLSPLLRAGTVLLIVYVVLVGELKGNAS